MSASEGRQRQLFRAHVYAGSIVSGEEAHDALR